MRRVHGGNYIRYDTMWPTTSFNDGESTESENDDFTEQLKKFLSSDVSEKSESKNQSIKDIDNDFEIIGRFLNNISGRVKRFSRNTKYLNTVLLICLNATILYFVYYYVF